MRLLWLADVLRAAGLTVIEEPGWRTRGAEFRVPIAGVIGHHTASSARGGDCPSTRILIVGRTDLAGPLAQIQLCRSGHVHIIASGIANHAGTGLWPGIPVLTHAQGGVNGNTIGIEAENNGIGEVWPVVQMQCYVLVVAALLRHENLPASRFAAHYEWRRPIGAKLDPRGAWEGGGDWYDGKPWTSAQRLATANTFRARVAAVLDDEEDDMTPEQDARLKRIEKFLTDTFGMDEDGTTGTRFGVDAAGHALDMRAKIDANYIALYGDDHPDSVAGRVKALADGTKP